MNLKVDASSLKRYFDGMISRSNLVTGWLNRVGYPMLLELQKQRWASEGSSEGVSWPQISAKYATYKLRRFRDYPGAGRKLLIATGRLAYSMTLDDSLKSDQANQNDHYKLVQGNKLEMGSFVPYAKYQQEAGRDMQTLSPQSQKWLADGLWAYIRTGRMDVPV